jgi:transportin-3
VYDLEQLQATGTFMGLRDVLLAALERYHAGPKNIIIQLSLAISGFALQVPAWENPVQTMIDTFGRNPASVPALLQFLAILPEELMSNTRIPITVRIHIFIIIV